MMVLLNTYDFKKERMDGQQAEGIISIKTHGSLLGPRSQPFCRPRNYWLKSGQVHKKKSPKIPRQKYAM